MDTFSTDYHLLNMSNNLTVNKLSSACRDCPQVCLASGVTDCTISAVPRTRQSSKISTCNHMRQGDMPCKDAGWLLESCGDMDAALSWNPEKPLLLESWRHAVLPNLHAQAANQLHHEIHEQDIVP